MLGLPKSTEMSKQLPKKAVYAKFQMNTAAKEKIDADISRITIVNEITPAKINIPAGEEVGSFFVLLVALKKKTSMKEPLPRCQSSFRRTSCLYSNLRGKASWQSTTRS